MGIRLRWRPRCSGAYVRSAGEVPVRRYLQIACIDPCWHASEMDKSSADHLLHERDIHGPGDCCKIPTQLGIQPSNFCKAQRVEPISKILDASKVLQMCAWKVFKAFRVLKVLETLKAHTLKIFKASRTFKVVVCTHFVLS